MASARKNAILISTRNVFCMTEDVIKLEVLFSHYDFNENDDFEFIQKTFIHGTD